jgi:hypothetical protein
MLVCLALLPLGAVAKHVAEAPIVLPEKYAPEKYAGLKPFERERCDRYLSELTLMEKRKRLGLNPGEAAKMRDRSAKIDQNYDRYCLKLPDVPAK